MIFDSMYITAKLRYKNYLNSREPKQDKVLYLTFDDGPSSKFTSELLDLLKENNVQATFFVLAAFAEKNEALIERMKRENHYIGLHFCEHKCLWLQGKKKTAVDIDNSIKIMKSLGVEVKYIRPPWGMFNGTLFKYASCQGINLVLWSVMAQDWRRNTSPEKIKARLIRRTKNGSLICLHDGRGRNDAPEKTIDALRTMISLWKSAGYTFKKVDDDIWNIAM